MQSETHLPKLVTIKQLAKISFPAGAFTESKLRSLLASSQPRLRSRGGTIPGNGLLEAKAVLKIGRRVYFDVDRFGEWIASKYL
jgi:hypothetical protein